MLLFYFQGATSYLDDSGTASTSDRHFALPVFGQEQSALPELNDEALSVEPVIEGKLLFPTSMAFVDNDTLLVTEKNSGNVISIINGIIKSEPVLSVEVNNEGFKGLLGITIMDKPSSSSGDREFVFLYFTELYGEDQTRNRVYRYEWDRENEVLVNGTMILDIPAEP
ncbi:MAG: PQQ-dependent sugar dehydrogenase, partial [Thermoproteota archaeon]|nr:PQQ-dependent sugar dehydrogenase [Thermoproteota archaeon]